MFQELSNSLFATEVASDNKSDNKQGSNREINTNEELVKKLSPNGKKMLDLLEKRLDSLKKQISDIKQEADPRMFNNPLPNDSVMTYQFGARAYKCTSYPKYVWRNGHWYEMKDDLKFEKVFSAKTFVPDLTSIVKHSDESSIFTILDDTYYPIFVNGTRIFVKEVFSRVLRKNGDFALDKSAMYAYFPFNQNVMEISNLPWLDKKTGAEFTNSELSLKYEDWENLTI